MLCLLPCCSKWWPSQTTDCICSNLLCRKTRRAELIEQRLIEVERVKARAKLQETEHKLSGVLYERGVNDKSFKAKDFVAEMTSMNVADRQSYITIQEPFERFIE